MKTSPIKRTFNFRHSFGEQKLSSILESTGSGCVWFDYNNDGLLDLYVLSGRFLEGVTDHSKADGMDATNHLYRNNGDGTFTDVTEQAGVAGKGFAMGVTVGDYDNDGYEDIYVTNWNSAILYHNNGDGTFTDVTKKRVCRTIILAWVPRSWITTATAAWTCSSAIT